MKATASASAPAPDLTSARSSAALASKAVAGSAPRLLDLGVHLADVSKAYEAWDDVIHADAPDGCARGEIDDAKEILDCRMEALREMIPTIPPASLADAAVALAGCITIACRLGANVHSEAQVEAAADKLERMLLAALPFVAHAAGLDMARMDWNGNDYLRLRRFAGVGVQS